jgi:dTDP-4-dehydrorhamnose reductase
MNKVLITGSEGMLGKALARALESEKTQIIRADINSAEEPIDITDKNAVTGFIEQIRPDIIVNTAAYTDVGGCEKNPEKAYSVNTQGVKNIACAARKSNSFLIQISTDYVFDGRKTIPYTVKDRPNPINIYGKSKLEAEDAVRDMLDNYVIIRTSWLFGKTGKNFVDSIIGQAESGRPLKVVDDQAGCPTYVQDLATAIVKLLPRTYNLEPKTIIHITNSGSCTWYEFAKEILKIKNTGNIRIEPVKSNEISSPAKRPEMSVLDNSEYIELTGNTLPCWQDALRRYLEAE